MEKYTEEEFIEAVKNSFSICQVLNNLGIDGKGSESYRLIKRRIQKLNLDVTHFKKNGWRTGLVPPPRMSLEDFLKSNPKSNYLKHRLYKEGLLQEICSECGLCDEWNGKPLTLQLDHIDGNNQNNDLSNLRILCPNCHTQTHTYGSKRLKIVKIKKTERRIWRKVERPSKEELEKMINEMPMTKIGEMYGVSSNSVKKWARTYGIVLSNRRGFWTKINFDKNKGVC